MFILLLKTVTGIGQTDSLKLAYDYIKKTDSLILNQEYELARDYLNNSIVVYSALKLTDNNRSAYLKTYNKKRVIIDRLITYDITDSMRYNYRLKKIREYIRLGIPSYGAAYLQEIKNLTNDYSEVLALIDTIIAQMPIDTVEISSYNSGYFQLTKDFDRSMNTFANWMSSDWININSKDANLPENRLYNLKDSLPFQGVISSYHHDLIDYDFESIYSKLVNYTRRYKHFSNGFLIADTSFIFEGLADNEPFDINLSGENELWLPPNSLNIDYFVKGFHDHINNNGLTYYHNGAAIASDYIGDYENGMINRYDVHGNLTQQEIISTTRDSLFEKYEKTILSNHHLTYNSSTFNITTSESSSLEYDINSSGDTTYLMQTIGLLKTGLHIDKATKIKSIWANNKLISFLNEDIIYVDRKLNIIDELSFLELVNAMDKYYFELSLQPLKQETVIAGKIYRFIAYPEPLYGIKNHHYSKLRRKLDRPEK